MEDPFKYKVIACVKTSYVALICVDLKVAIEISVDHVHFCLGSKTASKKLRAVRLELATTRAVVLRSVLNGLIK